jgi:hypothetical protein
MCIITERSASVSITNRLRVVWVGWLTCVIVGSLLPGDARRFTHTTGLTHHTVHVVAFLGVAVGASSWPRGRGSKLVVSAGVAGLGALIELLQHYFYGNAYEWPDVRDDAFGVLASILVPPIVGVLTRLAGVLGARS